MFSLNTLIILVAGFILGKIVTINSIKALWAKITGA